MIKWYNNRTPYTQENVNIGTGPPGSKVRWFRSASNEPRFINTITFDSKQDSPTLVMVHGYAAAQGFFFRNFDALTKHFRVIAIDQLGWVPLPFVICIVFLLHFRHCIFCMFSYCILCCDSLKGIFGRCWEMRTWKLFPNKCDYMYRDFSYFRSLDF